VAQNQLNINRNEYKNKLEAMTKVYKNVIEVRMTKFMPMKNNTVPFKNKNICLCCCYIQKLTSFTTKGERIIKTAENCAKLMNDDDNNIVFHDDDHDEGVRT